MTRVAALGAILGAVLGLASMRRRGPAPMLAGSLAGAAIVAALLTATVQSGQWLFEALRTHGPWAAFAAGAVYGAGLGGLFGGLGIAFFGFVVGPPSSPGAILGGAFGRGAAIVAAFGAMFGGIAGVVVASLFAGRLL